MTSDSNQTGDNTMPEGLPNEPFGTLAGPDGSIETFNCPDCGIVQVGETVREEGGCGTDGCDWELPGGADG